MSNYTHCRGCGTDLISTGSGFGARECCCNEGWCHLCCPETVKRRRASSTVAEGGQG